MFYGLGRQIQPDLATSVKVIAPVSRVRRWLWFLPAFENWWTHCATVVFSADHFRLLQFHEKLTSCAIQESFEGDGGPLYYVLCFVLWWDGLQRPSRSGWNCACVCSALQYCGVANSAINDFCCLFNGWGAVLLNSEIQKIPLKSTLQFSKRGYLG